MALCWLTQIWRLESWKSFSEKNSSKFKYVFHRIRRYFYVLTCTNARNISISLRTRTVEKQSWKQWGILFWTRSRLNLFLNILILGKSDFLSKMHYFPRKFQAGWVSKSRGWGCGCREEGGGRWLKSHCPGQLLSGLSPGTGSVGAGTAAAGRSGIPAGAAAGGATRGGGCQGGRRGAVQGARDRKEQSSVFNAQLLNLEERCPGSSALQEKEVVFLEEKGVRD